MSPEHLDYWLHEILPLPTAPFHEDAVRARVRRLARERGLGIKEDRAGNLLLEYRNPGRKSRPVAFTCHMDHPGFEVMENRGRRAKVRLLGGVDEKTLKGSRLVFETGGKRIKAQTTSVKMAKDRRKEDTVLRVKSDTPLTPGQFGWFDLVPLSISRGRIRSKALDNLISAALICALFDELAAKKKKAHVYGLFTVGEEVGFAGAMEAVKGKLLPKKLPVIVMETSRELPSFKIGEGPVIRVGDRMSVFDDGMTLWLSDTAEALTKQDKRFKYQRALMPGGWCEATLFQLAGWTTGALAIALDNYHNMGKKGAAAEAVSHSDTQQMLQLMEALSLTGPDPVRKEKLFRDLERVHRRYAPRFKGRKPVRN